MAQVKQEFLSVLFVLLQYLDLILSLLRPVLHVFPSLHQYF